MNSPTKTLYFVGAMALPCCLIGSAPVAQIEQQSAPTPVSLPTRLYATRMTGESVEIDFSDVEVPELNHDTVRIVIPKPICPELRLADHPPRYGERLYFFGDAGGAGVMCAEAGTVIAIGLLEFEHTADIVRGMSGGPVVDADYRLVGLCQKGRKLTALKNGVELPSDSRYLKTRRFGAVLHNIKWRR